MDSLSRPFHSRKLSNATSFSGKNAYDAVFSGHRHNKFTGPSPIDVQDYREIFGNSQAASSIPVLDLSTLGVSSPSPSDASSHHNNLRSSKPDYAKIFGGFRDEDIAVSYQDLFARDKARTPSSTTPTSRDSDKLSHQSSDVLKQFNMSYNKISQKSKDELDGTKHVTKLHATPGFTCFIDETVLPPNPETEKHKSSAVHVGLDSSKEGFLEKQTSGNVVRKRSKHDAGESFSEDKLFKAFDIDPKVHPFAVWPPASPTNVVNDKIDPKRSTAMNSESCKTDTTESAPGGFSSSYFDEELDVNSAASASAAALKKAIEKAQESIRIAKESVGRKKKGLRSFSSKTRKNNLVVEGTTEDANAGEEHSCKHDVKGVFGRVFPDIQKNYKYGGTAVFPDFMEGEKLFTAKKVIDEIQGKFSESSKESSISVESAYKIKNNTQVTSGTETRPLNSVGKDEHATLSSEAVDTEKRTETPDFVNAVQTDNMSEDDYEGKIKVTKPATVTLEHHNVVKEPEAVERAREVEDAGKWDDVRITRGWEGGSGMLNSACFLHSENGSHEKNMRDSDDTVEVDESKELEENKDEARLSNANELVTELNNLIVSRKVEDEKKISQEFNQHDNDEKQEVVVEEVENAEKLRKNSKDEASNKRLEDASEWLESENESKDDNTEIHKEQGISRELENREESAQTCAEESEVTWQDDCEMKQEDNSSVDNNVMEETCSIDHSHVARDIVTDTQDSCDIDMNDNSVETAQEIDDVTGASCEFQVEDTETMKQTDATEGEFKEKSSVDETTSDGEDESEVKSNNVADVGSADTGFRQNETEGDDAQSESSSGSIHGVEIEAEGSNEENKEEEESNNELPQEEIPETGSANGVKASQEPRVLNETEKTVDANEIRRSENREKEDEIRETVPSNVAGKQNRRRIDEVTAREREREKNRLAVDRAIREARERAFAEARERAERAAVEKATEEVRQRMMADVQEKVAKASVATKLSSERRSAESKLRAERAAVERATAEARQRALEKAVSQKSVSEAKRQSSSSSDSGSSNGSNSESALRSKAKLEKHNRIMERAAKALAEKEKRDLLAQKEQAERNRLAENLDADIKRWSKGKEGNLRALLSTLQYILGPESGWQPVALTEIIATSAVKKAYRKATLCVHPDKLQQRGASIQQKYICEKVFDLLKAAWNRFNSEER